MADTVRVAALTTCEVGQGGAQIQLRMLDPAFCERNKIEAIAGRRG
jgi:hypothetical protein